LVFLSWRWHNSEPSDEPSSLSFDGASATVIAPTFDTPIPPNKSAIWCLSFELAWKRLLKDVFKEPIRLQGASDVAERSNRAPESEDDFTTDSFYAVAGCWSDGIVEHVRQEIGARFPRVSIPPFAVARDEFLA
jgi:hypothetical protein